MSDRDWDVVVIGAGNAAGCAALAAREHGASVVMLECAPEDEAGGNTRFTAGAMRVVYDGVEDIQKLVPDLSEAEIETTDFGTYTADQFFDDIFRVTQFRCDPDKAEALVTRSLDTLIWMREKGVGFIPIYGRQAFKIDGKFKFWGGLTVETRGGGPGLYDMLMEICAREGIEVLYQTRAIDLAYDGSRIIGHVGRRWPLPHRSRTAPAFRIGSVRARPSAYGSYFTPVNWTDFVPALPPSSPLPREVHALAPRPAVG